MKKSDVASETELPSEVVPGAVVALAGGGGGGVIVGVCMSPAKTGRLRTRVSIAEAQKKFPFFICLSRLS